MQTIRLLSLDSFIGDAPSSVLHDDALVYDLGTKHSFAEDQKRLTVQVGFGLKSQDAKQTKAGNRGFCVRATYEATYDFKTDPPPPEMRDFFFEGFAGISAVHHLWPFWRELIHSLTQRFGMDPIAMPLIKFVPETKPGAKEVTRTPQKPAKQLSSKKPDKPKPTAKARTKH